MKPPTRLLIGAAFVLVLAAALIVPAAFDFLSRAIKDEREAIAAVLDARVKLKAECWMPAPPMWVPGVDEYKFAAGLKKIDPSDCPEDFRLAWIDYVHAWDRKAMKTLGELTKGTAALTTGLATKNFSHTLKRAEQRDVAEAFRGVQRVAVAYGVPADTAFADYPAR